MSNRSSSKERNHSGKKNDSYSIKEVFSRAVTANSEWPDKDEFLDVIYWARQILGIVLGIIWGIIPLKGFLGLALFTAISCGVVYFYAINFQSIDEESYGGPWELIKEGFITSFAGFLVTWIIFYTGIHYEAIMEAKGS